MHILCFSQVIVIPSEKETGVRPGFLYRNKRETDRGQLNRVKSCIICTAITDCSHTFLTPLRTLIQKSAGRQLPLQCYIRYPGW